MERRLSAILAADVVGYSRLMGEDETGTLERLKSLRKDLVQPAIVRHHGRIVKLMGDGLLAEFPSVVEAVRCARSIQGDMGGFEPERIGDSRLRLRIGVNLGDVIVEGRDIYGDGVNLAARLEEMADPGGICISSAAFEAIDRKVDMAFEDTGIHELRNIVKPVRVYKARLGEAAGRHREVPGHREDPGDVEGFAGKPSIAVLPLENLSGDPEQEYFADGITEDLIITLGRSRWLMVIARASTFAYKGKPADIRTVSKELGVRYVLEGSVRRAGDRVRVTVQLSDGREGTNIVGERFDRQMTDVFDLQEELATLIAGTIEPELAATEGAALRGRSTKDLNAWDSYQKGLWHLYRFTLDELATAKGLFERAISLDSGFSQAHARLAYVFIQQAWYGPRTDRPDRVRDALTTALRAVRLDDKDPSARLALGRAHILSGAFEEGVEHLRMAVGVDPSFAQAHFALGQALTSLDQHAEAVREMDISLKLSPRDPHRWTFHHVRAIAHYIADDLENAIADEYAALRQPNVTFYPYTVLVAILSRRGTLDDAVDALGKLRRLKPGFTTADAIEEWHFGDHAIMTPRFMHQFEEDFARVVEVSSAAK